MATRTSKRQSSRKKSTSDFRISNGPVVRLTNGDYLHDLGELVDLPHVAGAPVLFAIARDPRTIFTYWEIDWATIFAKAAPSDRQVHLRAIRNDGADENITAVEPMAGSCYLTVNEPRATYRVEIGYYRPENIWNAVALSDEVTMPADRVSDDVDIDLATLPIHLSFQRLIDLFRASNRDALTEIVSRLQRRACTDEEKDLLSPEEWELLRAMNVSLEEMASARRAFAGRAKETALRKRTEAILGFGATSPAHGFGPTSPSQPW